MVKADETASFAASTAASGEDRPRRRFLLRATGAVGGLCALAAAYPFVASMEPSERAKAAGAPVETRTGGLAVGELRVVAWRGRPVWILRRGPQMLEELTRHDNLLADPDSRASEQPAYCHNSGRSIKPEYFVAVGVCTHLGCSPTLRLDRGSEELGAGWPGGFFCPCHGSKFDLAGRVFKSVPAPVNLEIPPHRYLADSTLVIGVDQA